MNSNQKQNKNMRNESPIQFVFCFESRAIDGHGLEQVVGDHDLCTHTIRYFAKMDIKRNKTVSLYVWSPALKTMEWMYISWGRSMSECMTSRLCLSFHLIGCLSHSLGSRTSATKKTYRSVVWRWRRWRRCPPVGCVLVMLVLVVMNTICAIDAITVRRG